MDLLKEVDIINSDIGLIRNDMLKIVRNDSQRCLEMDKNVLYRMETLKSHYLKLRHEQRRRIHSAYSVGRATKETTFDEASWFALEPLLVPKRLQILAINVGKSLSKVTMGPSGFKLHYEKETLKKIRYPSNVQNRRPFKVLSEFRYIRNETNNFLEKPIYLEQSSIETLILTLDSFVQRYEGNLNFTNDKLNYNDSVDRLVCGIADFGNVHLISSEYITSSKFNLLLDIDYDDFARYEGSIETFIPAFIDALAIDLSLSHEFIRITSFEKSDFSKGKTHLTVLLTTHDKQRTEELASNFREHIQMGIFKNSILKHIVPSRYAYSWSPVISYFQIRPSDFVINNNFDHRASAVSSATRRGGLPYHIPVGWYFHALKVDHKYKGKLLWAGTANTNGEWPVAYHGTRFNRIKGITDVKLTDDKSVRERMFIEAIDQEGSETSQQEFYVTTNCNGGSHPFYTEDLMVESPPNRIEYFHIVFQCRVKPNSYTQHTVPVRTGEAWRITDPTAVRLEGILLKNRNTKVPLDS